METGIARGMVGTVAAELRDRVLPGHAGDFLPGVRVLSKTLGVSVPTICKALHLLRTEGLLHGGGDRRRWRVIDSLGSVESNQLRSAGLGIRSRRLLYLSSSRLAGERFSGVEVFTALIDKLGRSDWEVAYREIQFTAAKTPRRAWDELLESAKPDAMVVLGGTEIIGKWAVDRKIRTLFVGGTRGESGLPGIFVKVSSMLRDAAARLLSMGHRRVLFPLCARSQAFVEAVQEAADLVTAAAGVSRTAIDIVSSQYSGPDLIVDLLRREWSKEAPDALILLDWREFVAAESFLHATGIVIPRDLSVIVLTQNATMEWHQPQISYYEHPVAPMAKAIAKWVEEEKVGSEPAEVREFMARWVSKQSVLPRAGARHSHLLDL